MEMFYKLNEIEKEIVTRISDITKTDYGIVDDELKVNSLMSIIEDMAICYEKKEEEFEDYKQFVADNFKQVDVAEQVE